MILVWGGGGGGGGGGALVHAPFAPRGLQGGPYLHDMLSERWLFLP